MLTTALVRTLQFHAEAPQEAMTVFSRRRRLTKTRASAYRLKMTTTGR